MWWVVLPAVQLIIQMLALSPLLTFLQHIQTQCNYDGYC